MKRFFALLTILAVATPVHAATEIADDYAKVDRTKGFPFLSGGILRGRN